jgi:hypothetical protein
MGKPTVSAVPSGEYIASEELTQGTETSKYLKEYKSTEIPVVVASEPGLAQTTGIFLCGVVGSAIWTSSVSGTVWKVRP